MAAKMNRGRLSGALVVAAALLYPVVVVSGGSPHFPDRNKCAHEPRGDDMIEAVFGRFRDRRQAVEAQSRDRSLGFEGLVVERDACSYIKIVLHGVPSLAVGDELVAEAARVGVRVTLERDLP